MKIFDKLINAIGLYGQEDEIEENEAEETPAKYPVFGAKKWEDRKEKREERFSFLSSRKKEEDTKLISMPLAQKQVKVVVVEPINFDDAQKIADYLRKNQPVVVNFEDTDSDVMKRVIDFISGTIYALSGSMKKIGRSIMVCAPQNVDIDAGGAPDAYDKKKTSFDQRSTLPWER